MMMIINGPATPTLRRLLKASFSCTSSILNGFPGIRPLPISLRVFVLPYSQTRRLNCSRSVAALLIIMAELGEGLGGGGARRTGASCQRFRAVGSGGVDEGPPVTAPGQDSTSPYRTRCGPAQPSTTVSLHFSACTCVQFQGPAFGLACSGYGPCASVVSSARQK